MKQASSCSLLPSLWGLLHSGLQQIITHTAYVIVNLLNWFWFTLTISRLSLLLLAAMALKSPQRRVLFWTIFQISVMPNQIPILKMIWGVVPSCKFLMFTTWIGINADVATVCILVYGRTGLLRSGPDRTGPPNFSGPDRTEPDRTTLICTSNESSF